MLLIYGYWVVGSKATTRVISFREYPGVTSDTVYLWKKNRANLWWCEIATALILVNINIKYLKLSDNKALT